MAEKYGTIPDKFTRAWWDYIWCYYKWWILGVLFALMCITITAVQCATSPKYDITMTYAGFKMYDEDAVERLKENLAEYIDDVNENGEKLVNFQQLNFTNDQTNAQYEMALMTKLDLELQMGENHIFLFDKQELDKMMSRDYYDDIFLETSQWSGVRDEELLYKGENGKAYAVNLKNSRLLKELNIYRDDLYITIHQNYSDDEEITKAYQSALKLASALTE